MHLFVYMCMPGITRSSGLFGSAVLCRLCSPCPEGFLCMAVMWVMAARAICCWSCTQKASMPKVLDAQKAGPSSQLEQRGFQGWMWWMRPLLLGVRDWEALNECLDYPNTHWDRSPGILTERPLAKPSLHVLDKMSSMCYSFVWVLSVQSH